MRPLTKVILVLLLVGLAVGVLFVSSRDWSGFLKDRAATTGTEPGNEPAAKRPSPYNDSVAMYERWRERLTRPTEPAPTPTDPAPGPSRPAPVAPAPPQVDTSSRDEGKIVGLPLDQPVAGADPPGPTLRPTGIVGDVVTGPFRRKQEDPGNVHTVVSGDTLYGIAEQHFGNTRLVQAIIDANPGLDPQRLPVGAKIVLPDPEAKKPEQTQPKRPKVYVVQRNDTLIGIARRIYGDAAMYPRIYEANKDVLSSLNARLYVGQRLRLPEPE